MGARKKPAQRRHYSAQFWNGELLKPVAWIVVDVVALAEIFYFDGDITGRFHFNSLRTFGAICSKAAIS